MKLTIEQLKAWTLEASREVGFDPVENFEEELESIPDEEFMAALLVCTKAATWARAQALDEAAKAILAFNPVSPFHFCGVSEMANLVLSLKGYSK